MRRSPVVQSPRWINVTACVVGEVNLGDASRIAGELVHDTVCGRVVVNIRR
jgi:carbonic anhydrase/acetyltransferase-like protein (isoleucine patch superfamily)